MFPTGILPLARSARRLVLFTVVLLANGVRAAAPSGEALDQLIEEFFKPADIHSVSLSPEGGTIAAQKYKAGGNSLMTIDARTLKSLGYVGGDEIGEQLFNVAWVDENHVTYDIIKAGKYLSQSVVANLTLSDRNELMPNGWPDILDTTPYVKGDVLVRVTRTDRLHADVIRVDVDQAGGLEALEVKNPGNVVGWKADLAGQIRIAYKEAPEGRTTLLYRADNKQPWSDLEAPFDAHVAAFNPAGNLMMLGFPDAGRREVIQPYDLEKKKLIGEPISDPVYDVQPWFVRDKSTREVAVLWYEAAKPRAIWFDPEYAELHRAAKQLMPGLVHWFHGVTAGNEMLVSSGSDVQPSLYWLIDTASGKSRMFKRSRPWIKAEEMCAMEPVSFPSRDGQTIHGYLTKPRARTGPQPLIMVVHGGPYTRDTWGFDSEAQFFAALGYAVLQVNYRGSTGYGEDYQLPTYLDVVRTSIDDVADGARWAVQTGVADEKRLAVYGASFGGYAAMASATRYPDLYRCVMGFAGVYDFENHFINLRKNSGAALEWLGKRYDAVREAPEKFRQYSPVYQAAAVRCPVWLRHGGADPVVAAAQTRAMAAALKKAGKDVDVSTDTWGVHGFYEPKERQKYYRSVAAFLQKHLPVE